MMPVTQPALEFATLSAAPKDTARSQQPALILFAIGLIGLGVIALVVGDFAMVWQPVAPWMPGRTALAYLTGLLEVGVGCGLLFRLTRAWAARILFRDSSSGLH